MLSITHIALGATAAHYTQNPLIYIPISLMGHYIGDALLHWDCGTGLENGSKSKRAAILQELFELSLSAVFLSIVFFNQSDKQTIHILIASFFSILPDLIEAPKNFLGKDLPLLKPLNTFHAKFHNSTPNMIIGFTPQLIFLFLVYLLV